MATNTPAKNKMIEAFEEGTPIDEAVKTATREAILRHYRLGQPIVIWRDGKPHRLPPEEIPALLAERDKDEERS